MKYQGGMSLADAAERIAPIAKLEPGKVAGFVLIVIVDDDDSPPAIAASENIPPHLAAHILDVTARHMFAAEMERQRKAGEN